METAYRVFKGVNMFGQNGCWEKSPHKGARYPSISIKNKKYLFHRWSYEFFIDKIPPNYIVRHTCHNTKCVNPRHLKLGTPKDNTQDMVKAGRHHNQKKTHCKRGHELSGGNLYVNPSNGTRHCQICKKARRKLHYNKTHFKV